MFAKGFLREGAVGNSDIISNIRSVFSGGAIPTVLFLDENIIQKDIPDELRARFFGKSWHEVSLGDWRNVAGVRTIMGFMTASAFYYYVPSLLTGVLGNLDFVDWGLEALVPNNARRIQKGEWWFEYLSLFSMEQRTAVLDFICYVEKNASDCILDEVLEVARKIWSEAIEDGGKETAPLCSGRNM